MSAELISGKEMAVSIREEIKERVTGLEEDGLTPGLACDADSSRANAPKVGTFSHEFDVILADGVETTLAEVPKPDGGSLSLALAASILD